MLAESGHVGEYVACIRDQQEARHPLEQRAALWALGHIGSSPGGFALLMKCAPDAGARAFTAHASPAAVYDAPF